MQHAQQQAKEVRVPKKRFLALKIVAAIALLAAVGTGIFIYASNVLTEQAHERMRSQTIQVATGAYAWPPRISAAMWTLKSQVEARSNERATEELSLRDRIISEARQVAIDEAHAQAIADAHRAAIEEARAAYDQEVEAIRARRSSDFSDTILYGDSIMQNSQGALASAMPGVSINAFGGRSLEEGPSGTNFDPNDGVMDHIRSDTGGYTRYVIGTGNNDAGGLPLSAGEEVVAHLGEDKEIYFVTEYVGGNMGGTANTNATIANLVERFENVHAVEWYELVSADPGAYLRDGVHPLAGAMPTYANLIRDTISKYEPEPFDPHTVEFDPASVPFDASSVEFDAASAGIEHLDATNKAPQPTDGIMGKTTVSSKTMVAAFAEREVPYPTEVYEQKGAPTIEDFVELCIEEAHDEGVRAEVLFAQVMHETGWLQFGNQVSVDQCNFGGLGATSDGSEGAVFEDVRMGLRAQVQHLKAYASTEDLVNEVEDLRFDLVERGVAPTIYDLEGRWAFPGDGYGDALMNYIMRMYEIAYGA